MEYDIKSLVAEALAAGFSQAGELNMKALVFMPEVRDMCAAGRCRSYGHNWRCPPACGSIEDAAARAAQYSCGILVQTIGKMEDDFDYDTIAAAGKQHNETLAAFTAELRSRKLDLLPMGAGTCTICPVCAYPDAPCRFPERSISSMEAYGLWVSRVCKLSELPYNNGPQTITYTGCILFK